MGVTFGGPIEVGRNLGGEMPGDLPETWPRKRPRSGLPGRRFIVENGASPDIPAARGEHFLAVRLPQRRGSVPSASDDRVTTRTTRRGVGTAALHRSRQTRPDHDPHVT